MNTDSIKWQPRLTIQRYSEDDTARLAALLGRTPTADDFTRHAVPSVTSSVDNNLLTTAGITRIVTAITAGTGNLISSTTARVGTGNGAGTAAIGDTDLSASAGSSNRWFQTCTVTSPSNVLTFAATFGTADGNYAWQEWGVDIATATVTSSATVGAVLLNHKTSIAQGTKAAGQTWVATATVTLA